jgi:hypothetical protein
MAKMKKRPMQILLLMVSVAFLTCILSDQPMAETSRNLDGASLIEQAKSLNGQEIVFQGEVIGDIMHRQDHYWINVLSSGTAIGIWITDEQRAAIVLSGQYGIKGDEVRIAGQFHQACFEHGGDLDVHANSLEVISKGFRIPQKLDVIRILIAAGLFILAGSSLIIFIKRHKQGTMF